MGQFKYCLLKHEFYSSHVPQAVGLYANMAAVEAAFVADIQVTTGAKHVDVIEGLDFKQDEFNHTLHWINGKYMEYTQTKYYVQGLWTETDASQSEHYSFGYKTCPNCSGDFPIRDNYCNHCAGSHYFNGTLQRYAQVVSSANGTIRYQVDGHEQRLERTENAVSQLFALVGGIQDKMG